MNANAIINRKINSQKKDSSLHSLFILNVINKSYQQGPSRLHFIFTTKGCKNEIASQALTNYTDNSTSLARAPITKQYPSSSIHG